MDPDVVTPDIQTIQTTMITTTDGHVINLTVGAGVDGKVEGRRINKDNIMGREVGDVPDSQQTRTAPLIVLVELISRALHGAGGGATEELKVVGVLDHDHVSTLGTSAVDRSIQLQRPGLSVGQLHPRFHSIVALRDVYNTTGLARVKRRRQSRTQVSGLIGGRTIIKDIACLDGSFVGDRSQWPDRAGKPRSGKGRHQAHKGEQRNSIKKQLYLLP